MVFSGAEEASGDKGHRGDITGSDPQAIGSSTGADIEGGDTGVTQGEVEAGT